MDSDFYVELAGFGERKECMFLRGSINADRMHFCPCSKNRQIDREVADAQTL